MLGSECKNACPCLCAVLSDYQSSGLSSELTRPLSTYPATMSTASTTRCTSVATSKSSDSCLQAAVTLALAKCFPDAYAIEPAEPAMARRLVITALGFAAACALGRIGAGSFIEPGDAVGASGVYWRREPARTRTSGRAVFQFSLAATGRGRVCENAPWKLPTALAWQPVC